jgi:predicted transcriptional regulator
MITLTSVSSERELREDVETTDKALDYLKQVGECVPAGLYALSRLVHLDVTRVSIYELEKGTYIKHDSETGRYCFRKEK